MPWAVRRGDRGPSATRRLEGAIAPREQGDRLTFFRSSISVWGTVEPDWEARTRGLGAASTAIQVDRVDIEAAFKAFGVPLYLKIDVEGVDRLVLETLGGFPDRPRYLSIKSTRSPLPGWRPNSS